MILVIASWQSWYFESLILASVYANVLESSGYVKNAFLSGFTAAASLADKISTLFESGQRLFSNNCNCDFKNDHGNGIVNLSTTHYPKSLNYQFTWYDKVKFVHDINVFMS